MEYLPGGIRLEIPEGCFPLTTDSMALADFADIRGEKTVLDLGSGCGTLGLLLCARNARCRVTGVELNEAAHTAALENIRRNRLDARMESICADMRRVPELFAPGAFDCCISNPPYFSGGFAARLTAARREDLCTLADLMQCAARALKYGGDLFLVHRPERLAEAIASGAQHQLETKRLRLLRHREGGPVALVLLQLRKGSRPGLTLDEIALHRSDGSESGDYRRIYHIAED